MKKFTLVVLMLVASVGTWACPTHTPVCVISVKSDIFYFKVSKTFIGATVEIYSKEGERIRTETVLHHKTIIDFYLENPGVYTIKIKKDNLEHNFSYVKDAPPLIAGEASVSMVK